MTEQTSMYAAAELRVRRNPDLDRLRDVILYDWPEGEAHWEWVLNAPAAEIIDWAQGIADALTRADQ
jgi:uncharacterized protein YmfQ (DUF2313 family)